MALIGINQPTRPQQQQTEKVSGFDKDLSRIMQGLQIANAGFGIAVNWEKIQEASANKAAMAAQESRAQQIFPEQLAQQQELTKQQQFKTEGMKATTPTFEAGQKAIDLQNQKTAAELAKLKNPPKDMFKNAGDLRKEWVSNPITKKTQESQVSMDKIASAAQGEPSPAKQHSLIFNYMKMVDPGSTVREGEFATVQQAGSLIDRATVGLFNKTLQGEFLTPNQQEDFIGTSKTLFNAQMQNQQKFDQAFTNLAERQGVNPRDVVLDLGFKQQSADQEQQTPPPPGQAPQGQQQPDQQAPQGQQPPTTQGLSPQDDAKVQAIMEAKPGLSRAGALLLLRKAQQMRAAGGGQ